jgi:hypothetical protein
MTLVAYDADRLDETALRILDIAARIRQMAGVVRSEPGVELAIHEKKAAEWLAHLERWAAESQAKLELALVKKKGAKRAEGYSPKKR